jgi:integrase
MPRRYHNLPVNKIATGDVLKVLQPLWQAKPETASRLLNVNATAHGFRSSFRDWAGDQTAFQREVIEAALAHVIGDKAEQAYRRGDALEKRRALMEAWGRYIEGAPANVAVLRQVG